MEDSYTESHRGCTELHREFTEQLICKELGFEYYCVGRKAVNPK